jgi:hypothetical protein
MKGDGWHLLAENSPEKLTETVNKYLVMGFELRGNAFAVYGVFAGIEQIWHYQAVQRGDPDLETIDKEAGKHEENF